MPKKYILLESQRKKYKLYSEDIKMVFMKTIRKIPKIPQFPHTLKSYEDDTEESNVSQEELKNTLSH